MSNLLPQSSLRALRLRTSMRFVILASAIMVTVAAVAALALMPAYLVLATQHDALAYEVETLRKTIDAFAEGEERTSLTSARQQVGVLTPLFARETQVSDAIETLIDLRANGVTLTGFQYTAGQTSGVMRVIGAAQTRQQLAVYAANLKGEPTFTAVDVPISSLAGRPNGPFSISVEGDF